MLTVILCVSYHVLLENGYLHIAYIYIYNTYKYKYINLHAIYNFIIYAEVWNMYDFAGKHDFV